jgi:hypothetical protein
MALKITKSTDTIKVENLKVLVYGQPSSGKTTLSFTSKKALLLDFDNGAYRSGNRGDSVQVDTWSDVVGISEEDLKVYDTIIIDTAGQMLNCISNHIKAHHPNSVKRDGDISIQGYGMLKSIFESYMSKLIAIRKDVIIIAHDREISKEILVNNGYRKTKERVTYIQPDISGGSLQFVKRAMDLMGYISFDGGNRVLDFNPSELTIGKNSAGLPPLKIPNITNTEFEGFLDGVLTRSKEYINQQSLNGKSFFDFKKKISDIESPEMCDALLSEADKLKDEGLKRQVKILLLDKSQELNLAFDKISGKFFQTTQNKEA